jgi:hypothetical protein
VCGCIQERPAAARGFNLTSYEKWVKTRSAAYMWVTAAVPFLSHRRSRLVENRACRPGRLSLLKQPVDSLLSMLMQILVWRDFKGVCGFLVSPRVCHHHSTNRGFLTEVVFVHRRTKRSLYMMEVLMVEHRHDDALTKYNWSKVKIERIPFRSVIYLSIS